MPGTPGKIPLFPQQFIVYIFCSSTSLEREESMIVVQVIN